MNSFFNKRIHNGELVIFIKRETSEISLVNMIPKELKQEIIRYCPAFAFVLYRTGLFAVSTQALDYSRKHIWIWASTERYCSLLKWAEDNGCFFNRSIVIGNWDHYISDYVVSIGIANKLEYA